MKERPIIFTGESIRAILGGTKSMTRRIMTPQPEHAQVYDWRGKRLHDSEYRHWCWRQHVGSDNFFDITGQLGHACPLGVAGDRLWVRETHHIFAHGDPSAPGGIRRNQVEYAADDEWDEVRWRSPVFMPRWASRLTLEIVSVRVERLQDISEEDARAEGIKLPCVQRGDKIVPCLNLTASPLPGDFSPKMFRDWTEADFWRHAFAIAWDRLHGKGAWMLNPWVWVIAFKMVAVLE